MSAKGGEPVRVRRTRAFLWTHLGLCALAGVAAIAEQVQFDLDPVDQVANAITFGLPTLLTFLGFAAFRRRKLMGAVIPGILGFDSLIALAAQFREGSLETPWTGVPILVLVMLPLFSEKARLVWALAAVQILGFAGLLYARANDLLPYEPRVADLVHDPGHQLYMALAYVTVVIAAAVLAGRTSVDVLNSQETLRRVLAEQEKALQAAQARIVQHEKMASVGQLTAGIAHEINNPLTFVRTNLTSLERDVDDLLAMLELYQSADDRLREADPETAARIEALREDLCLDEPREVLGELLGDATEGVDRVQGIIRDLRVFSRLDEAELKPVDVREGIRSTLRFLEHHVSDRGLKVVLALDDVPQVEVYAALLNQVFMNILQNAVDAVPRDGGLVRVSTCVREGWLLIEFADNGPGVPENLRESVFDPFFTTKEIGQGTGLGLSLSYQIVEKHGGLIRVGDAPEGGALLTVELPLQFDQRARLARG